MKLSKLQSLAFLLVLSPALPSLAAQGDSTGAPLKLKLANTLRLVYAHSDKVITDTKDFFIPAAETKATFELSPDVRATLQLRAKGGISHEDKSSLKMPYGYLDIKTASVDFRLGKQIVAWGRTDALNPTDILTPRDYTTLLPFDEDERSGIWGLRTNFYMNPELSLSVFYSPDARPSTLSFASNGLQSFVFETPRSRQQLGIRLVGSNEDFDFSVSAFRGMSLLGQADSITVKPDGGSITHFGYPKVSMLGADFAHNFGKYGFRAEAALVRPENEGVMDRLGARPYRYLVLGGDRTFYSNLNITTQLFGRWADRDPVTSFANPQEQGIAKINQLIFVQTRKNTYGMTFRIANRWLNETLDAELFIQHYFGDNSTYLHPMVRYAVNDHLKLTAGAVWYVGKDGTLFGSVKKNNGVFAEVRYSF